MEAKCAKLQAQERLKTELVQWIKMLEYVPQQERAKHHSLKFETDSNQRGKRQNCQNKSPIAL